jgi:hypothetical protein
LYIFFKLMNMFSHLFSIVIEAHCIQA